MKEGISEFNATIARNVRFFRTEKNLSLDDLADKSDIPKTIIFRIENEEYKKKVSPSYIHALANALGVSEEILTGQDEEFAAKLADLEERVRSRKYSEADIAFADSLVQETSLRGPGERVIALHKRGVISFLRGEYRESLKYYEKAIDLALRSGAKERSMWQLERNHLEALLRLGRYDEVQAIALPLVEQVDDKAVRARILFPIGVSYYKIGQYEAAITTMNLAIVNMHETDRNGVFLARCYEILGTIYRQSLQPDKAVANSELSLDYAIKAGDELCQVYALRVLGEVSLDQGEKGQAHVYFSKAREIAERNPDRKLEKILLDFSLARCEDYTAEAYRQMSMVLEGAGEVELSPRDLAEMNELTAKAAFANGDYVGGQKHYEAAIGILMAVTQ